MGKKLKPEKLHLVSTMAFFRKLLPSWRSPAAVEPAWPLHTSFYAAGCAFTDGKLVLAGYQPNKRKPGITGLGGMRETKETYTETAFRETIEELFHVTSSHIPTGLALRLQKELGIPRVIYKKGYITLVYTLEDLGLFLRICRKAGLRTPLYPKQQVPTQLLDLLQKRTRLPTSEVQLLCLLPVIQKAYTRPLVKKEFQEDMRNFLPTS